ncbi:ATP phosphoribosyltransferase [bacterium]|nr:MAG: ATP phosphoribosyltransferase [bacterium]
MVFILETEQPLRIGIQKSGRLTEKTIRLLEDIGLKFDDYKSSLMVKCRNLNIELLLIRDDDIPEYVQDGVCDLGFVGANVTAERNANVSVIKDLEFGYCRLSLASPKNGAIKTAEDFQGKRIATSYPNLTKNFFSGKGIDVRIVEISGAVEIAPTLNVADAICDLVSTGSTLKANGLVELEPIFYSQTQLIRTNQPISAEKQELIERLLLRINGRQLAEKSRYIMLNAPASAVEEIKNILPSAKSPTILPLADPEMVAIHSVVPINQFWDIMERLKQVGASDMVILPIQSLIQ